jgi:ATP/maltotriose-dependent transcriptional regulator MalT
VERRRALADEALAIAERSGDDAVIVWVLNHTANPSQDPTRLERALELSADALERAKRIGDPVLLMFAGWVRAETASRGLDIDEMDRCCRIVEAVAEQLDQPMLTWRYTYLRAMRAQIAGDIDEAEALATEAFGIGTESGQPDVTSIFGAQTVMVHAERGTLGDLVPLLEQMAADAPDIAGAITSALAVAHAEADRDEDARRLLDEFAATGFALPVDQLWLTGMTSYAESAVAVGDPVYAEPLFDRLAPWADQLATDGVATAQGPVRHLLGGLATVLGRYDVAEAHFARAEEFNHRVGAKYFAARTNLWRGRMLVERAAAGDAERARTMLTEAHASASAHGYGTVERRAAALLRRLDGRRQEPPGASHG